MVSFSTQRIPEKKIVFFYKYFFLLSSTVCVENETLVAYIVSRKSYTRNLLLALRFSNFHFYVQNCRFRALFCRFTANQAEIQKKDFLFDVHQPLGLLYSENDLELQFRLFLSFPVFSKKWKPLLWLYESRG